MTTQYRKDIFSQTTLTRLQFNFIVLFLSFIIFYFCFLRMADSADSMSVQGASDEANDLCCDPCLKEGTHQSVAGYCPKCVEFYCQSCLAAHRRMAATERHKILLGSDMPACQADKPVKYQLCDMMGKARIDIALTIVLPFAGYVIAENTSSVNLKRCLTHAKVSTCQLKRRFSELI